ncbi:AI-2E family transporter [Patescibacteria group bacterium]
MTRNHPEYISISTSTILKVVLIALSLFFAYIIRDIIIMVFVAVVVAAAVGGPVNWLKKRKVPRILGVAFIYLIILLLFSLVISLIIPPLTEQIRSLASYFPALMEKVGLSVQQWWGKYNIGTSLQSLLSQASSKLGQATSNIFTTIFDLFGGVFSAVVVVVISFYLSVQEKGVKEFILSLTPDGHKPYISSLIERIQIKIGGWLRGQLILMLIIGTLTYIGLSILGIKYALLLSLIAGFLEIIPYLGPIVSTIPAVILTFAQSPFLAFIVLMLYIVIQQLENYVIVPQVMKRTVGLNPVTIIIVMLIGMKLAGILGIILSVPLAAVVNELSNDFKK